MMPTVLCPHPETILDPRSEDISGVLFIIGPTQIYAIVVAGIFYALLFLNGLPWIRRLARYLSPLSKHFCYRYILHRHRLFGPWSRAGVLL